jgi:Dyp-type peroxidase family
MTGEPELELDEIQGNILPGFKKDHQHFLFFRVEDASGAASFLRRLTPRIWTARQVLMAHSLWKLLRDARGAEPPDLKTIMINIAFTRDGIGRFMPREDLDKFDDDGFAAGLAQRAGIIGDPIGPGEPGSPATWFFGGSASTAVDVVVLLASDDLAWLQTEAAELIKDARASGITLVHCDAGRVRPGKEAGHEPFGFRDSISEPALRGRWPGQDRFVVDRTLPPSPAFDGLRRDFAAPGRPLVYPGHFLFGYDRQDRDRPDTPIPGPEAPDWAKNGSFMVYRRLRQDINGFAKFLEDTTRGLATKIPGITSEWVGAHLVGRWRSGTPVMRSPDHDIGLDDPANNYFTFRRAPPVALPGDAAPLNLADPNGNICPLSAHIRKVNPRDDDPEDLGAASRTLQKLLIRRGIPFDETSLRPGDEGLLFVAYQTSFVDQFEFLMQSWVNKPDTPRSGGGFDPILAASPGRSITIRAGGQPEVLPFPSRFVTATGGDYFFTPSISTLKALDSTAPPTIRT